MTITVQARIDDDIRNEAASVLERWGLTVSDAVRILLTRTAREGRLPLELLSTSAEHDEWVRQRVAAALNDDREVDDEEVQREFEARYKRSLKRP